MLALALAGMAGLALGMEQHHRKVRGIRAGGERLRLACRLGGAALLLASLAAFAGTSGWAVGLVAWFGAATAAALICILLLAFRAERFLQAVVGLAALLALFELMAG